MKDGNQFSFHGGMLPMGDLVFVGTELQTGHLYAFERDTSKVRWKRFAGPGIYSDVVGSQDRVFALTLQDSVLCLEAASGRPIWSFSSTDSSEDPRNELSSALADSLLLYVNLPGELYALRTATGSVAWKKRFKAPASTGICVCNGSAYVGTRDGLYYRLDPTTGATLGQMQVQGEPGRLYCAGDRLLTFLSGDSEAHFTAIDSELQHILWRKPQVQAAWTSLHPLAWRGVAIAGTSKGDVFAYDLKEGTLAWSLHVEGIVKIFGSDPERLYVGTQSGALYAFDP